MDTFFPENDDADKDETLKDAFTIEVGIPIIGSPVIGSSTFISIKHPPSGLPGGTEIGRPPEVGDAGFDSPIPGAYQGRGKGGGGGLGPD
jgi:hypothetical protein